MRIWDAETGKAIGQSWQEHSGGVNSVAFSPNGERVVSGSSDKTVRIWDAETGKAIGKPWQGHSGGVNSVAFSPDGKRVVSSSYDKTVRIWDAETGKAIGQLWQGHSGNVNSVAFSPRWQASCFLVVMTTPCEFGTLKLVKLLVNHGKGIVAGL